MRKELRVGVKILVIDDDQMIAESLKRVLAYEAFEVRVERNGTEGIAAFKAFKPDLVILDVMMPGMCGIDVCESLKKISQVPILFLSARDDVSDRVTGFECGGDDYLIKPFAFEELIARIKALLRRHVPKKAETLRVGDLTLNTKNMTAYRGEKVIGLSATEYQLLYYLMSNPHQVISKERILEKVWGYDFNGESNVVEVYIRYLRTKIEKSEECRIIHTVRGVGYMLGDRR